MVANNYAQGKTGVDAWRDVDGGKILVSTLTGAATGGLSSLKAVDASVKVYKVVAMGTTAGLGSMAKQQVGKDAKSGKVDVKEVVVDIATEVIPIPKIKVKKVPKSKIKTAKRQLDRAERVNRSNNRPSRQKAVKDAKKNVRNLQKRNENAKKAEKVINETKDNTLKEMTNNSLKKTFRRR